MTQTFDKFSHSYSSAVARSIAFSGLSYEFTTRAKIQVILDVVREELGSETCRSVLDVGCGVGNMHRDLSSHFPEITGVDVSTDSIRQARRDNPAINYLVFDGERLPF